MGISRHRKVTVWSSFGIIFGILFLLFACGDNTSTPQVSPAAQTVQSGATNIAGTVQQVAPTVQSNVAGTVSAVGPTIQAGATNVAGTVSVYAPTAQTNIVGSVQAGQSMVATVQVTPLVPGSALALPTISGVTKVTLDQNTQEQINKVLSKNTGYNFGSDFVVQVYGSDQNSTATASTLNTAMTGAGFQLNSATLSRPVFPNATVSAFYSKTNQPDVFANVLPMPQDLNATIQNLDSETSQKILTQLQGKQSIVFILAAPDLISRLGQASQGSQGTSQTSPTASP